MGIPDGSGGILMCGSCSGRFDAGSIFNKLQDKEAFAEPELTAASKDLLSTEAVNHRL